MKIYETKLNGLEKYGFKYEYSRDLDRDEFFLERVAILDGEFTAYIKLNTQRHDQISFKLRGGKHNSDHRKAGKCYIIGAEFDGHPFLAKEYPEHESTPKFPKKIRIADGAPSKLEDLRGRWVGIKVVIYNKGGNVKIEVYVDNKGLISNKPANDWKPWWSSTDDGEWNNDDDESGGKPYLKCQGEAGGTQEMIYIRIDQMKKPNTTNIKYESVREIDTTNKFYRKIRKHK